MYKIYLSKGKNKYEFEELVKVFLKIGDYEFAESEEALETDETLSESKLPESKDENLVLIRVPEFQEPANGDKKEQEQKNTIKRYLYDVLSKSTGDKPEWGILTGVRPVKLAGELLIRERNPESVRKILVKDYYLSPEKADLLLEIVAYQNHIMKPSRQEEVGLYLGIPFCPTRCVYCSFPANQAKKGEIPKYLDALHREIEFVSEKMREKEWTPESIYVGGGTPTTLEAEELEALLGHIIRAFNMNAVKEFTVEAGRPDTITAEKLSVISQYGVHRISINPQSMNEKTLELIGRAHKPQDITESFRLARQAGIPMINTDVIAGLPEETTEDFIRTMDRILELAPENITVHTLAMKRASRLKGIDSEFHYRQGQTVREMLDESRKMLAKNGYKPYYLYRQKQMTGNFENVGYAKGDTAGIYNIRIMEEAQTIVALGAGGISKAWYPAENRLERIPNVTNQEIYVERLEEMMKRKQDDLFVSQENKKLLLSTEQEARNAD